MDWLSGLFLPSHLLEFVLVVLYLQGEILYISEDQGLGSPVTGAWLRQITELM